MANPSQPLPRATPESLGIVPDGIAEFVRTISVRPGSVHSFMLLRHGKVASEGFWYPYSPERTHLLYSLSKSFTSTAIGLAVHEGLLRLDDQIVKFFPEKLPDTVSENLLTMTVRDLLTMSTGHASEPGRSPDGVRAFLAQPVEYPPGTHFLYNTPATNTLAAILLKVSGKQVTEFLENRLLVPLGIYGLECDLGPDGVQTGGSGMRARTEDIAKFGQLLLQRGTWNGRQLVPADWIDEATREQVSNGDPNEANDWTQGYGYQFWRTRHNFFRGDGAFGQFCIVMPHLDAVLAVTSGVAEMGEILEAAFETLLPAFDNPDRSTGQELNTLLGTLVLPGPSGSPSSCFSRMGGTRTYRLQANEEGIQSLTLRFEPDYCFVSKSGAKSAVAATAGYAHWHLHRDQNEGSERASRFAWQDDRILTIWTWDLSGPYRFQETFRFEENQVHVSGRRYNVGFGQTDFPDLWGTLE